jgi:filamentous hemagglutinin
MYAGAKQVVSGNPESTFLNQGLQGLGMSPEAAGLVEAALGVGSAVTAGAVANKAIDKTATFNNAAQLSYSPIEEFSTKGLQVTQTILNTPIAQAIMKEYVGTGLSANRESFANSTACRP